MSELIPSLKELQKSNDSYENHFEMLRINTALFPNDIIDPYLQLKENTKLSDLDPTYIRELIVRKRIDDLELRNAAKRLENKIADLEDNLLREESDIKKYENFIMETKMMLKSEEEIRKNKYLYQHKEQKLSMQKKSLKPLPASICLDELISKIGTLEKQSKK